MNQPQHTPHPDQTRSGQIWHSEARYGTQAGRRSRRRLRRPGPVGIAALVAAVLVLTGIGLAAFPPLLAGASRAEMLPPSSASPYAGDTGRSAGPPSPTPTVSLLTAPPNPNAGHSPAARPAQLENRTINLINQARQKARCPRAGGNGQLRKAARRHSDDMARHGSVSHTGSDNSTYPQRARAAGYRRPTTGEVVGAGYRDAKTAVSAWLANAGQRGVLLNCTARAIGVGVAIAADGKLYWTADFGS